MEKLTINTPVGTASYPHLTAPDEFMGKLQYKCDLRLDPKDADVQPFVKKVEAYVTAAKAEALVELTEKLAGLDTNSNNPTITKSVKKVTKQIEELDDEYRSPISDEYDRDSGEATGLIIFKMKSNADFVDKKTKKKIDIIPKLYDADGNFIRGDRPVIKGGSKLSLQAILTSYVADFGCGVSSRLGAVQIVKLSSGGGSGGDAGFGKVDGGFVQEAPAFSPAAAGSDDSMDY